MAGTTGMAVAWPPGDAAMAPGAEAGEPAGTAAAAGSTPARLPCEASNPVTIT